MISVQRSRCQVARAHSNWPAWSSRKTGRAIRCLRQRSACAALAAGALACDFVDPSLAFAALDTRPERLARDVATLGLLFESLVVRVLRIDAQALDTSVVRDTDGPERDPLG